MATTQFLMVEELASLIKDNLFSKHLVLSTEEALINFLQDNNSLEGVLELQPMSPYDRLLLHRLADIYGFAHLSVGEGEDRHLVLERCPETTIPTILVSDILWQYDEYQSPAPLQDSQLILRRKDSSATEATETPLPSSTPFEERKAAYLAARERIFSLHPTDTKESVTPKSRNVPVVARRMIAHALGKKIPYQSSNETTPDASDKIVGPNKPGGQSCDGRQAPNKAASATQSRSGRVNQERDEIGGAKRIFANALGISPAKGNQSLAMKHHGRNRSLCPDR